MPPQAKPFAAFESQSLSEIVRDVNKFSNNVMARQLYLTLGAELASAPGSTLKAERAIRQWLAAKQMNFRELVLENGAGLSRIERMSARSMADLLLAAHASPLMPELLASLPLVAVDGTMRRRLKNADVAGQAHIKGGTLAGVRAIAGFVFDNRRRMIVVVCIVNHARAAEARPMQEALLQWVYARDDSGGGRN